MTLPMRIPRSLTSITLAAFLLGWPAARLARSADAEGKTTPNIVFVLADDLGYGDLGCFGGELPTPRLDQMAAEGMRMTQHYAGSTVCAPSRCVLLTGKSIGRATIRGNQDGLLPDGEATLGSVLSAAGYQTACIGKWGVGHPPADDDPNRCGFDFFYGYVNMFHAHNFYPTFLVRNGVREPLRNVLEPRWRERDPSREGRGVALERVDYAPELITNEALDFIDRSADQPFFLYLAFNTPHANNEATHGQRPERGMEVPDFGPFAEKEWPAPEKGFAEMVRRLDLDVGRVLDRLKALGIDDRTLVVFSSDNGPHMEGGHDFEFFNSNGPLRGTKRDLYEGGVRVPTIVRWPGKAPATVTTDLQSGFQDWLPTLCEVAEVPPPPGCDGVSLLPTLTGNADSQAVRDATYFEFTELGGRRSIRRGRWKAIQYGVATDTPGPVELYDLSRDLGEEEDVAATHPEVVAQLTKAMDAAHTRSELYPLFPHEGKPRVAPKP